MGNIKFVIFFFFHKNFIKIFIKPTSLGKTLTFPFSKYYNLKTIYKFYSLMEIVFVDSHTFY